MKIKRPQENLDNPQVDFNSPEFQKALEIARNEILGKKNKPETPNSPEPAHHNTNINIQPAMAVNGGFENSVSMDSMDLSELRKAILNRALEILQEGKKVTDPHGIIEDMQKLS